ncbi:uncharacterized protein LOC109201534 [Oreochromis niloticus]|uniref:uncharacterized protein LOC109201534 n=1 Tax=Oreochromis niloticus TaxID=8128 RepID=UPI0009056211|nr:uncharacterized protein LOC109201534 [Oreochromis niloticus]
MGNKQAQLTPDEEWLEKQQTGAGRISANRWRNPQKAKNHSWEGKCNPSAVTQLRAALKQEITLTIDPKKKLKRKEEYKLFQAWETEAEKRTEKRKKKEEKKKQLAAALITPDDETIKQARAEQRSPLTDPHNSLLNPSVKPFTPAAEKTTSTKPKKSSFKRSPIVTRAMKIKFDNAYENAQTMLTEHEKDFHPGNDHGSDEGCDGCGSRPEPPPPSTLACPLVEVANPRYGTLLGDGQGGGRDNRPTIFVYRPWTHKDRQNVIKGIPLIQEGYEPWQAAVREVITQWHLNGHEVMQLFQDCLGLSWGRIRGDFTGSLPDGTAFPPGHVDLQAALIPVFDRARQQLAPRANYGKIGQVKQSDTENPHEYMDRLRPVFRQNSGLNYADDPQSPYQQQFKRAFIKGLLPSIRSHVEKYWVTQDTGTVDEALQYANHAQTVVKNKEKTSVFALDTDTAFTAFSGSGDYRGGFRGQKRGREMHRRGARGKGRFRRTPNNGFNSACWECGKRGHLARDCGTQRTPDTE